VWLATALGSVLGLGGQAMVAAAEHGAAIAPRPVAWFGLVGLLMASAAWLLVLALGEALSPLRARRRLIASLEAALLAAWAGLHGVGIGVRVLAGDYPSAAGYQMLLASPVQFLSQALYGYASLAIALPIGVAATAGLIYTWLSRPRPALSARAFRAVLLGAIVLLVTSSLLASSIDGRALAHATPELALHSTLRPLFAPMPVTDRARYVGEPQRSGEDWLRAIEHSAGPRPNVILLLLESIPADHLGFAGYRRAVSPNIDALARRSLRMRRVWSVATQSNYAQMAFLSSLHPRRRQQLDVYEELGYPRVLPHDIFSKLGYATATISSQNEDWQGMRRFCLSGQKAQFFNA
jgi:glucan phosphoethanolaminetransferase (alkaline phosphatase superfamily)